MPFKNRSALKESCDYKLHKRNCKETIDILNNINNDIKSLLDYHDINIIKIYPNKSISSFDDIIIKYMICIYTIYDRENKKVYNRFIQQIVFYPEEV